jgi:hypothetical protein
VVNVPKVKVNTATLSDSYAKESSSVDITFKITPYISIPANGYIKIIFDKNLVVNEVDSAACMI